MAVPGTKVRNAPPDLARSELFAVDAYRDAFDATVVDLDREQGRVALARTAFFPGGGGQPCDTGELHWDGGSGRVGKVTREDGRIWHWLDAPELPGQGTELTGALDWERRHLTMRTHTALHILCGVLWSEYKLPVTGGNMEPGKGRLDFPLEGITTEFGALLQRRINEEIDRAREVLVDFLGRDDADLDPAMIRTSANLIPREIDPLRVIDIAGLDKQADGGTHVTSTAEVERVVVTKTESKGKSNKRVRLEVRSRGAE